MVRCLRCNVKEVFSDFIERRDYTLTSVPCVIFNPILYNWSDHGLPFAKRKRTTSLYRLVFTTVLTAGGSGISTFLPKCIVATYTTR